MQRGGAERCLLSMLKAAPDAEVVTPFYEPAACYPEFRAIYVRASPLNRVGAIRRHHRATLPVMPLIASGLRVDADVVVCGTSGWAQGVRVTGRKVLYFHSLARWLYERDAYLKGASVGRRAAAYSVAPLLKRWDQRTVATGHRFITQGTVMQRRLAEIHGIEAEIIPPPNTLDGDAPRQPIDGLDEGFFLCASRLLPYKNVDVLVDAFADLPGERLVVAGDGPQLDRLRAHAGPNVHLLGSCDDARLRWLYASCRAVISAAVEPFGLTPVEGAAFGKPTVALRAGGFVDTVIDGETGVHFSRAEPADVMDAIRRLSSMRFEDRRILAHAQQYSEDVFVRRLAHVIDEEAALV